MDHTKRKLEDAEVVSRLMTTLVNYQADVSERNNYIDKRDRYLYGDGLFENVIIPDGFDQTMYNYLRGITQVHASQFMQQKFGVYAYYDKSDTTPKNPGEDDGQVQQAKLDNEEKEIRAWAKKNAIEAMIRDNGGYRPFLDGAQVGSDYGSTLYQMWWDDRLQKIRWQLIESIQNWFPVWSDNNFRERLGDAYVMQIEPMIANRDYKDKMPDGGFSTAFAGEPLTSVVGTTSTVTATAGQTVSSGTSRRPMVTMINYTGYLKNVCLEGEEFYECQDGEEAMLSFISVGNVLVSKITEEKLMPKFYYIPNVVVPRRPYGESDLPEAALQINTTIIQVKSDQISRANKVLFPIIQAIGFEDGTIPPRKQREMTIVPMMQGQSFDPVRFDSLGVEYSPIIEGLLHDLLRVTRVPRVLFDDPTVSLNSNQALLTSLRPMIDVVSKKQQNWEPVICQMMDDALELASEHVPELKALLAPDDNSYLYVRWPSVLRQEDPAHQVMVINDFNAGLLSVDTAMELRGIPDVNEEINRITSDMDHPVKAAILGKQLGTLAHFTIQKSAGIPPWGYNLPKITLRGDIPPQEVGNMGHQYGWDQGPYGAAIGPTGAQGTAANDNWMNSGLLNGDPYSGGTPASAPPGGMNPSAPQMTPGQNGPGQQPMSQPGSGATSVTPAGAGAQDLQRRGRR